MLFGAGNLIFPVHLGQLAGSNCFLAAIGFILSAVLLPIAGVAAIGFSNSSGLFAMTKKISPAFGYIFTCLLYLTIGPFFAIPRCASLSYTTGFAPIFGDNPICLLIFSALFFAVVLLFSLKPNGISVWIGKIINPIFLVLLLTLIIMSLLNPGQAISEATPVVQYEQDAFFNGFVEGYGTMDAIAGLAFGIVIVDIIKKMGVKNNKAICTDVIKSGNYTAILMALIYLLTIVVGTQSTGLFEVSANGGIALTQLSGHYFGPAGQILLGVTILLACLKTSIGLVTSCSAAFVDMFPKGLKYKMWAIIFTVFSFAISNVGLTAIIDYSYPVLGLLYPISIVLILLVLSSRLFKSYKPVYLITLTFTLLPAIFEFLKALPSTVINFLNLSPLITWYADTIPLASLGISWVFPAIIGFVIGMIVYFVKVRK